MLYRKLAVLLAIMNASCNSDGSSVATIGLNESKASIRKNLKVCFVTPFQAKSFQEWYEGKGYEKLPTNPTKGIHPADQALIESIVQQEFKSETTLLTFSGFQDCEGAEPSNEKSNVYIFRSGSRYDEAPEGLKPKILALTNTIDYAERFLSAIRYYDSFDRNVAYSPRNTTDIPHHIFLGLAGFCGGTLVPDDDCVKLNTLHEFGHIAGLGHAHNHPDAKNDPACKGQDGSLINGTGVVPENDKILSAYTAGSVMNYCHEGLFIAADSKSAIKSVKLLAVEQAYIRERTAKASKK